MMNADNRWWAIIFALPLAGILNTQAQAGDPIADVLAARQNIEWGDNFDVAVKSDADVRTSVPVLSDQVVSALATAIAEYSSIATNGGWPIVSAQTRLQIGVRDASVAQLRRRLTISGDLAPTNMLSDAYDSYVVEAVERFQARHGIQVDGVVGASTLAALNVPVEFRLAQLTMNLDRLKGLGYRSASRFVMVNIPAARVEAVESGRVVARHTAIAGKVDRPSPILSSKVTEVNFNPFWTVPKSIIRKDLIPTVRKNPAYLSEYGIRILDAKGIEIQPEQIDWNTDDAVRYTFRQDPSEINSLGSVRINFPNNDSVYMHDTPNKGLFNDEFRFASSGCVRIRGVRDLVTWLLRDNSDWSPERVGVMFGNGERLDVKLATPVPVFWTYITAWTTEDGVVQFRDDVYGLDREQQLAFSRAADAPL